MARLVVVSNRVAVPDGKSGGRAGGLEVAVQAAMRHREGVWFGWSGKIARKGEAAETTTVRHDSIDYVVTSLGAEDYKEYYNGFANRVLWPVLHYRFDLAEFSRRDLSGYMRVNEHFATELDKILRPDDLVWVHDYHLMYVAQALRERSASTKRSALTFFLHIPFPPYDIFSKLPQQQRLLHALLQFDLLGFQTRRDVRNFLQCVRRVMLDAKIIPRRDLQLIRFEKREIRVGHFPIGIDFDSFENGARSDSIAKKSQQLRGTFPGCQLILGSDRLDYSKGIPERLRAFRTALERHSELRGRVVLIQVVVPSRVEIPRYHEFKQRIDRLVGDINGRFSTNTWLPVQYHFRCLERDDLLAHYRACDIAFITPLKDGMNLVAKEYCACRIEEDGALILSQFAGAAEQLKSGALLVNPYDIEQMADTIVKAFRMTPAERTARMKRLRRMVRKENVFWWVDSFLAAGSQLARRVPRRRRNL